MYVSFDLMLFMSVYNSFIICRLSWELRDKQDFQKRADDYESKNKLNMMELKKISKQLSNKTFLQFNHLKIWEDKKSELEQLQTKALFHEDFKVFSEFSEKCCQQLVDSQVQFQVAQIFVNFHLRKKLSQIYNMSKII